MNVQLSPKEAGVAADALESIAADRAYRADLGASEWRAFMDSDQWSAYQKLVALSVHDGGKGAA